MTARTLSIAAVAALPLLGGCSVFEDQEAQLTDCPSIATLESARTLTRFAPGGGRDLSDAVLQARIDEAAPTVCRIDDGEAVVEMQVRFDLAQGPAASGENAGFGYFVAISDPDSRIVAREGFALSVDFPDTRTQASAVDDVVTTIPLPPGARLEDYRLIVGLQLTREELEYNRRTLRP